MNANEFDDYWVQSPKTDEAPTEPALRIDTVEGVEPLDAQLGVAELKTVPDALYEPLFGQPSDAPLHTYAILDAAKVPNLPELLEASGLKHRCLFKGDAYDELKNVAPWIVQLDDGNAFTRNLFTSSDASWHLWDNEPGIYLRSGGTLECLWKHFRKFIKVQDKKGKWYYARFYDPCGAVKMLDQTRFWRAVLSQKNWVSIYLILQNDSIQLSADGLVKGVNTHLLDIEHERQKELKRKLNKNADMVISTMGMLEENKPMAHRVAQDCMARMMRYGFVNERHLRVFATWELTYGIRYEEYDPEGQLLSLCKETGPALRRFKKFTRRMDQVNFRPRVG